MESPENVEAVLVGGPSGAPAVMTISRPQDVDKIKISYLDGYEHFEREADTDVAMPVYRWTMRTKIAE